MLSVDVVNREIWRGDDTNADIEVGFDTDCQHENYDEWWRLGRCVRIVRLRDLLDHPSGQIFSAASLCIDESLMLGPKCLDGVRLTTRTVQWTRVGGHRGVARRMPEVRYLTDPLSSITRPDWPNVDPNAHLNLYLPITQYADGYSKFSFSQYQHSPVGAYTSVITDYGFGHTAIPLSMLGDNSSRRILWNQFSSELWQLMQGVDVRVMHPIDKKLVNATLFVTMGIAMFDSPEALKMGMISRSGNWRLDRLSCRCRCNPMWSWPHGGQSQLDYKVHVRDEVGCLLLLSLHRCTHCICI